MPRDFLGDSVSNEENFKPQPRDFLFEQQPESKLASATLALPRIGEDIVKGGYNVIKNIPQYYQSAQNSIPSALNVIQQNPKMAASQGLAGIAELGQNVFNTPHDIINYLTQRLHLVPENINQKVQMSRMPEDTKESINQTFGNAQNPGEEFIRGLGRNSLNLLGGGAIAKTLNPLQLTNKGISKKVVNELNNQVEKHTEMYNKLWSKAEKQGFNKVPYDENSLNSDMNLIKKYYTPKQYKSVENFSKNPNLENAQRAQSDLGSLRRALEEKSKTNALLGEERNIYDSLENAERNIESNMFKNHEGKINNKLANQYKKVSKSYRNNVVPYRYNQDIQDYLSKDITAKELVQRLNKGPFAAKKGGLLTHPQFGIRNALLPVLGGIGALGGGKYLYDQALGNTMAENK